MQNKPGLLSPAEGPPLEQIIEQAVDVSLAFLLSAGRKEESFLSHPLRWVLPIFAWRAS